MKKSESDDDFIKSLFHAYDSAKRRAAYDPVKAHAYYERTKKLKGRKKGTKPVPISKGKKSYSPLPQKDPKTTITQPSTDTATRAADYQARLQKLKDAIQKRNEASKASAEKKAAQKSRN